MAMPGNSCWRCLVNLKGRIRQIRTWANCGSVTIDIKDKDDIVDSIILRCTDKATMAPFAEDQKYRITLEPINED